MATKLIARSIACLIVSSVALWCPYVAHAQTTIGISRSDAIAQWPAPPRLERGKLERAGLRVIEGRHITLITDLPPSPAIDELPTIVDAAVPQLAVEFDVPSTDLTGWRVRACLIADQAKFEALDLIEPGRDTFPHGLSLGYRLWVREQTSDYYRRHLLLHEVTHSFMATQLGGCGPGWYMEAMAEVLGTHNWNAQTQELTLGTMPATRNEVPMWGRTKLIADAVAARQALPLTSVLKIDNSVPLEVNQYAWCWALAKFLDAHPRYSQRWRDLPQHVLDPQFDKQFLAAYADDWSHLDTEWRGYVTRVDYGYDFDREAIEFQTGRDIPGGTATHALAVDRGWQSTAWRVEQGRKYQIRATGQYIIAHEADGTPWPCEAGGVTLDWYGGRPLGQLLAVIDPRGDDQIARQPGTSAFLRPVPLDPDTTFEATQSGTLYLRVNDHPAELSENQGRLQVTIRRLPE